MAEKEKILVTYDWDRTYGEPWPVFRLSALERLDNDYLDAVARRIERALNPLAEDEGAEFRVVLKRGRRWAHLRIEALQDNSPRYQVRRARFDTTAPDWWAKMAGFIAGFMGVVPEDGP